MNIIVAPPEITALQIEGAQGNPAKNLLFQLTEWGK
jgi:hypothetical protein